jgi:hypothetical protein
MAEAIIGKAREFEYRRMRLASRPLREAATGLYVSLGFEQISGCEQIPIEGMMCMELKLV